MKVSTRMTEKEQQEAHERMMQRLREQRGALMREAYARGIMLDVPDTATDAPDWWPALAPLTKAERNAVREQVRTVVLAQRRGK